MLYTLKHFKLDRLYLKRVLKTFNKISFTSNVSYTFKYLKLDFLHLKGGVTVGGVVGRILSVEFYPSKFGWMNLRCGEGGS